MLSLYVFRARGSLNAKLAAIPLALAAVAAFPGYAQAASSIWNGTTGNWSDASRWTSNPFFPNNGTPIGTTYDVTISAGNVMRDVSPTIQSLTFFNGTLSGTGTLSILSTFSVSQDSTLGGTGAITTNALALANFSLTMQDSVSLTATGTSTWSAVDAFPQFVQLSPTNTFTNSGTFTLSPADNSAWNGGIFSNSGTLIKSGNTSLFVASNFNNSGTVSVQGGTLTLNFGTHSGAFSTSPGVPSAALIFTGTNTFNAGASVTGNATFADAADLNNSVLSGSLNFMAATTVNGTSTLNTSKLSIGGTTTLNIPVASTGTLTIEGSTNAWTGQLDLKSNAMVVRPTAANKATALATLQNQVNFGHNNGTAGAWTGLGITSSTVAANATTGAATLTVALADNADLKYTSFRGATVDANSLIVATVHLADANLDNKVDSFDLNLLAAHWQQLSGALWSAGDFNGDGRVDSFDLNILAANWQFGVGGGALGASFEAALAQFPQLGAVAVPEPGSLAVLVPAVLWLVRRRRGRGEAARPR